MKPRAEEGPALVWPPAPDAPRIAYLGAFTRPEDLGIAKGPLQALWDLVLGADEARLVRPMAVVVAGGAIYVADPGARGVHRFDRASGRHELIGAAGGTALLSPVGLALGPSGSVYVADSALAGVFVIERDASVAKPLALEARLRQPTGIAYDAGAERLFVADTAAHCIRVYRRDGKLESTIGRRGTADAEFNFPTMLWRARDGRLYVTDSLNYRVQVLGRDGAFAAKFGRHGDGSGDMGRHKGVATDGQGHVYVADALFHAVQVFDPAGRLVLSLGTLGSDRGEFRLPAGVFIAEDDTIYVADAYNGRVQMFRYVGGGA